MQSARCSACSDAAWLRSHVAHDTRRVTERKRAANASDHYKEEVTSMEFVLWILAVILVVSGILAVLRKQYQWGIVLIVVGLLVGPGGVSIFT